jgi:MSHA biogenesis protein MshO
LLVNTGRQALEQMTRQLRSALPYSVLVTNGGNCLKFLPIAGGGNYLNSVPDNANGAGGSPTIAVSPHAEELGNSAWVSIGALAATEIYGPGSSTAGLAARSSTNLTLSSSKSWQRNSINRRFYLLGNPQAFCIVGTQLRFYPDQSMVTTAVDLGGDSHLMANNVNAPAPFSLTQGMENRNTIVQINIAFASGGESVDFQQQVMIRNVP